MVARMVPERAIVGFRLDADGHWIADLACGHSQHMRHRPPFVERAWVVTAAGRAAKIGTRIDCRLCTVEEPAKSAG